MIPEKLYYDIVARAYSSLRRAIVVSGFCEGSVLLDPMHTPTILGELARDAAKLCWRPIESAHKHNDMEVLLLGDDDVVVIGAWSHRERRFVSHTITDLGWAGCEHPTRGINHDFNPTHWCPLPGTVR